MLSTKLWPKQTHSGAHLGAVRLRRVSCHGVTASLRGQKGVAAEQEPVPSVPVRVSLVTQLKKKHTRGKIPQEWTGTYLAQKHNKERAKYKTAAKPKDAPKRKKHDGNNEPDMQEHTAFPTKRPRTTRRRTTMEVSANFHPKRLHDLYSHASVIPRSTRALANDICAGCVHYDTLLECRLEGKMVLRTDIQAAWAQTAKCIKFSGHTPAQALPLHDRRGRPGDSKVLVWRRRRVR